MTQLDRAREACKLLPRLSFDQIGALRMVLKEAHWRATPDGSIEPALYDDLECMVAGIDAAIRALERMKLRAEREKRERA